MNKILGFLAIAFFIVLANGAPALATDGRTAVGACIDNPKCTYDCDASGDCLLTVGGKVIHCPTPTGQCVIMGTLREGKKPGATAPNYGKPVGANVNDSKKVEPARVVERTGPRR